MAVILYDFEVFKEDWMVVFKEYGADYVDIIINDPEDLANYFNENRAKIFAGFNVKYYDTWIFKAILSGLDPYEVSKQLIEERVPGWRVRGINKNIPILTYDLSQDIQGAPFLSLKEAEGNMGMSIVESSIDFTIDRKLTDEEMESTVDYCVADVLATERLFVTRYEDFQAAVMLIKQFNLGIENIDKTTAQLTAMILGAKKRASGRIHDELDYDIPDVVKIETPGIVELYTDGPLDYKRTLNVDIAGVPHKMAYGGLHGALDNYFDDSSDMVLLDVTSYYPSMMIAFDFMSRNAKQPERFKQMFDERVEYKAQGHPMAYPFKIAIAATFGCMKNQYNPMYDPKQPNQICITGQLLLVDLIEKLEPHIKLIQSNTDGILISPRSDVLIISRIVKEWEDRSGMNMEWDWGVGIWQKDVNNYIYLHEGGKMTVKGAFVKGYNGKYTGDYRANSIGVVHKAVVEYLVRGTPPEDTINNETELIRFQTIHKAGASFDGGNKHEVNGEFIQVGKVNRMFATTDKSKGKVYKVKRGSYNATPNISDNVIVFNESVEGLSPDDLPELDKQWYIDLAYDRIDKYIKGDIKA